MPSQPSVTIGIDAENLARLARLDPRLLSPIEHRGEVPQAHLALLCSREALVGTRTKLVNHVRGAVKSFGSRLPIARRITFITRSTPKTLKRRGKQPGHRRG